MAVGTAAECLVIAGFALRVPSALSDRTRIRTLSFEAGQIAGAVFAACALARQQTAGSRVRVADRWFGAAASERAGCVLANGALVTRSFGAFVDVGAPERRSDESFAALALAAETHLRRRTVGL